MKVTIAPDKYLVSPLEPGTDLKAGDTADVPDRTAEDWIKKGWAVALPAGKAEADGDK